MDLSLDDVISFKQRDNRGSYNSPMRGRGRGRGRGSVRIGAKQYKTLTIKKSKLAGVELPQSSSHFDEQKPLVISSSTPGKRYFSNVKSDFSPQSKLSRRGFRGRNQSGIQSRNQSGIQSRNQSSIQNRNQSSIQNRNQSSIQNRNQSSIQNRNQSSIQSRIGAGRTREEEDSPVRSWSRGGRTNRRNRGTSFSVSSTVPRVNQQERGFKGLASNSKKTRGLSTNNLRSPSKNSNLISQHIQQREQSLDGSGFRFNRTSRGRGRDNRSMSNRSTFDESLDFDQDDNNIQVTFANPKASSRSNRQTAYAPSGKESSSKRFSSATLSTDPDPGENILISVQNENARAYVPEGVEIDPTFITHKTHSSLNERFSKCMAFEGKERIIQKHSIH